MTLAEISARYEGHPFVDYFDCLDATLAAAKNRSKLAVRARLAGDEMAAAHHRNLCREYMRQVRNFHNQIDWIAEQ
jgi:hypothetical protein